MIAVYGGTFDPIHLGHLAVARGAAARLGVSEVRLLLSARPSHRDTPSADIEHRWQMLVRVCSGEPLFAADRREIDRAGPSYAVLTLAELRRETPELPICWVVGQDSFATLPTWHDWQSLFELAHFVVVPRPGSDSNLPAALETALRGRRTERVDDLRRTSAGKVFTLPIRTPDISSTRVRQLACAGQSIEPLTGWLVDRYVRALSLYQ